MNRPFASIRLGGDTLDRSHRMRGILIPPHLILSGSSLPRCVSLYSEVLWKIF